MRFFFANSTTRAKNSGVALAVNQITRDKKKAFLVDFQYRANPADQEAVKLVKGGAIGKIVCGEANFITGCPFGHHVAALRKSPKDPEVRLRGWGLDAILSGDIIVEQNVHQIDVATWVLDAAPVAALLRAAGLPERFGARLAAGV